MREIADFAQYVNLFFFTLSDMRCQGKFLDHLGLGHSKCDTSVLCVFRSKREHNHSR